MEETKWWTRLLIVSAVIAVALLLVGPLGYKYGLAGLQPSLISLLLALVGALIVFVAAVVMVVVASRRGLTANRKLLLIVIGLSLIPIIAMGPQILKGRSVPPIHDITTDTVNPPTFDAVVALRANALNPLEYGAGPGMTAEKLAGLQNEAYPNIKPLATTMDTASAVAHSVEVLSSQGLEVVNVDPVGGMVEAVATTFWFGFKDDVVVRVTPSEEGSVIDVRSISRVGISDVGANAARIEKFLNAF